MNLFFTIMVFVRGIFEGKGIILVFWSGQNKCKGDSMKCFC